MIDWIKSLSEFWQLWIGLQVMCQLSIHFAILIIFAAVKLKIM